MGECTGEDYTVKITAEDRVSAVLPLQEHWLPLSNLDLLLPPLDVGVFFCYKNGVDTLGRYLDDFDGMVSVLKASLAKALVAYYPFAGEVVANSAGEPEVLCNNRGVDFIVASADVDLERLNLYNADESVEKKLVPEKKGGVISVQATKLKCGGMVLACTFDHRIADAYSANMFLVHWAKISSTTSGGPKTKHPLPPAPSFRRSLLGPRRPGHYDFRLDQLYIPISSAKTKPPSTADITLNRIYSISSASLDRLQSDASLNGERRTKIEAFTAYLWQLIAKGAKRRHSASCIVCRMGIVVNGRSRMENSMQNYIGNVLSIPYGALGVSELEQQSIASIARAVHVALKEAATEEHFRGLVDWVEEHRPEPVAARIYLNEGEGEDEGVAAVVSSGRGFPVGEVEFGWGRPVFGSYHFPWGGGAGYVMPMPSARGDGSWVVYAHLGKDLVDALEEEGGDVFRPLTAEFVMGSP